MANTNKMNPTPTQIRQARLTAGLSIAKMAEIMGVTRQTIYNWEDGTHPMKPRDFEYMQIKLEQTK